ncbi:hypothetical protein [Sinimarinibacterium thermocellulolyticum]|uniref:Uncharacterized protein n=1 Tax=Sinimarinibacterium thermocellulolyticum TaxID=3170016 RepID=A0ABV2AC88_9GAMM
MVHQRSGIIEEAARIVCVELLIDYRQAKRKAAQRLGLPPNAPLPDNAAIHAAVLDYQRLFGGDDYLRQLRALRRAALAAMRLLAAFSPRLVGAVVSGAVTAAHRVQLHVFSDAAEAVDVALLDRGIDFEPGERTFRLGDGREQTIPLLRFEIDGCGIDVAVFAEDERRHVPINPLDGKPFRRLDYAQAERLAAQ